MNVCFFFFFVDSLLLCFNAFTEVSRVRFDKFSSMMFYVIQQREVENVVCNLVGYRYEMLFLFPLEAVFYQPFKDKFFVDCFEAKVEFLEKRKKGSKIAPFFSTHSCDPCRIQTYNLLIRSQMLYSVELMGHQLWCWTELNCRHTDFQSVALPTELQHRCFLTTAKIQLFFKKTRFEIIFSKNNATN